MSLSIVMMLHNLNGGGIQNYVKELSLFYDQKGYSIYVVCNSSFKEIDVELNVLNFGYHTSEGLQKLGCWLESLGSYKVFAHTFEAYKACYKLRKKNTKLTRCFFNVIHVDYYALYYRWYTPFKNIERTFNYRKLFNGTHLLFVSKGALNALTALIGVKPLSVKVVGAPLNFMEIKNKATEKVNDLPKRPYMVLVSRLVPRKNVSMAIKALHASSTKLILVIIGSGAELSNLKKLVDVMSLNQRVVFLGWKENPFPYVKYAKCLVSSSNVEGFGLTLVESMVLGTPVISTDAYSGPKEILGIEYKNYLIPTNDICRLSKMFNIVDSFIDDERNQPEKLLSHIQRFNLPVVAKNFLESH